MEINFAKIVKDLRKERGNTQEELAEHLGISVQAVSKWERGDGMPDITLLPNIAYFYNTTVDELLGCDSVRKEEDMAVFKEKAQILINKGRRQERLELCRAYQMKYPNDGTVLFELMHDLFRLTALAIVGRLFRLQKNFCTVVKQNIILALCRCWLLLTPSLAITIPL